MALRIFWAESAWKDLESIYEYIARDSRFYAVSFVQQARDASRSLESFAKRGRIVPELGDPQTRELFVMNHRLIYRLDKRAVHIVALIHGSRDLWSIWKKEG